MNQENTNTNESQRNIILSAPKYSSLFWPAVIAGAVLSLAAELLLNFLGIGLGLSGFDTSSSLFKIGASAIIWLAISGIIAMGLGGWITGKFCKSTCKFTKAYHGLLAWSIATLVAVTLTAMGSGAIMGGAISIANNSAVEITRYTNIIKDKQILSPTSSAQTQGAISNESTSLSDDLQNARENLDKVFIILFIAFLLSGAASAAGAALAGTNKENTTHNQ